MGLTDACPSRTLDGIKYPNVGVGDCVLNPAAECHAIKKAASEFH
jgi:hypothetical protein